MLRKLFRRFFRDSSVSAIVSGQIASDFSLQGLDGKRHSLSEALARGPVLAAFFKVSCPVCQFTFPYLQRLYEKYSGCPVTIWGISQDDARDTQDFCEEFNIEIPMLIEDESYATSNAYGLTNVPTIFLIAPDSTIRVSCVGFSRADIESMAAELARASAKPPAPLFLPSDIVPEFKPG
jgi:peroxiredoxin